jgi:hypothetical protein
MVHTQKSGKEADLVLHLDLSMVMLFLDRLRSDG